jgi:hypothetical protein
MAIRRNWILIGALSLLPVLVVGGSTVAQVSRFSHLSGRIVTREIEHRISDTTSTTTQVDAVLSVRMRRDRVELGLVEWVDDGSSYQVRSLSNSLLEDCPNNLNTRWTRSARFDEVDESGTPPSSIRLATDEEGAALLQMLIRGGPFWESGCNPPSARDREDAARAGLQCNWLRNECLWPDDGLRSPRADPPCPQEAEGIMGTQSRARTRIDFTCKDEIVDPPGLVWSVFVTGYLRFAP